MQQHEQRLSGPCQIPDWAEPVVRCNKSIYENWIKGIRFARGLQYIKPFIKMILGDESTTEMSRNDLSSFSTSVVFLGQDLSTAALSGPLP